MQLGSRDLVTTRLLERQSHLRLGWSLALPGIGTDHSCPVEVGHAGHSRGEENGMSEPVGKGQDFRNEPKSDDLIETTQQLVPVEVETDFDIEPGLDNVARKGREVGGGRRAEGGGRREAAQSGHG